MRLSPCIALTLLTACGDPQRPVFELPNGGDDDLTPPLILFNSPTDSVVNIGDTLSIGLRVLDRTGIVTVTAAVSGVLNFGFPNISLNDTLFEAQYPVPTASAPPGILNFSVTALDRLGNQGAGLRRFTLK